MRLPLWIAGPAAVALAAADAALELQARVVSAAARAVIHGMDPDHVAPSIPAAPPPRAAERR
ncbi:hypothetical protein ACFYVR_15085 [Rhodococcus sp. NPDC003318]|uniref:hypothetical protein n=1 Tax=Rhodococcus sp. NPDC003318 TaxID=3364503 RepID=UPI003680CECA